MEKFRILISLAATAVFLIGCDQNASHSPMPADDPEERQIAFEELLESPEKIDYGVVATILKANQCTTCHSTSEARDRVILSGFDTLFGSRDPIAKTTVKPGNPEESTLYTSLLDSAPEPMPPAPRPAVADLEIEIIRLWIEQGAPLEASVEDDTQDNDSPEEDTTDDGDTQQPDPVDDPAPDEGDATAPGDGDASEPGDEDSNQPDERDPEPTIEEVLAPFFANPETIDYQAVNQHVFSSSCNDCHSRGGSRASSDAIDFGVDLTSYEFIFQSFASTPITKGKPEQSDLFRTVSIQQSMPPTRAGYKLMNPYRAKLLRLWILNCAIETFDPENPGEIGRNRRGKVRKCEGE